MIGYYLWDPLAPAGGFFVSKTNAVIMLAPMAIEPAPSQCFYRKFLGGSLLLTAITFLIYWQCHAFEFTDYDDPHYVFENPMVTAGLSYQSVMWALTTGYYDFWHPLTWWSHMLDCELFGLNAGAHHLVNVGLHLANAILLLGFLASLTGKWYRSLLVAALFAVHPLHVESVAWVAERKDVLSTFFFLLSLWAYVGYARQRSGPEGLPSGQKAPDQTFDPRWWPQAYCLALLFFALGLMAKAMLVSLPFVLLLLDLWPLGRLADVKSQEPEAKGSNGPSTLSPQLSTLVWEKWPFFLMALLSAYITYATMAQGGNIAAGGTVPLALRLANIPVSYATYLVKLLCPVNLAAFYPLPKEWDLWRVAVSILLLVFLSWLAVRSLKNRPWYFVGWWFFVGTLVPVIGLVPNGFQAFADRYTYIPSIGFFVGMVWGIGECLKSRGGKWLAAAASTALVGLLGWLAWCQAQVWQNSLTLWTHCLRVTPVNPVAENNLGYYYWCAKETAEAIRHYRQALRLRPGLFEANVNLGVALADTGKPAEAAECFRRALAAVPEAVTVNNNMALVQLDLGNYAQASEYCQKVLASDPNNPQAHAVMAKALSGENQPREAMSYYQQALHFYPGDAALNYQYGLDCMKIGDYDQAAVGFSQAVYLKPQWAEPHFQLALVFMGLQETNQAIEQYRQTLQINPDFAPALNNLAWLLATAASPDLRNGADAVRYGTHACELTSYKEAVFVGTLAAAYAEAGQFQKAQETAQRACDLASASGQTNLYEFNLALLKKYQNHLPYRE